MIGNESMNEFTNLHMNIPWWICHNYTDFTQYIKIKVSHVTLNPLKEQKSFALSFFQLFPSSNESDKTQNDQLFSKEYFGNIFKIWKWHYTY